MTLVKKKLILSLLAGMAAVVVATAVSSGADQPFKAPKTMPDTQAAVDAVRAGKARALPRTGDNVSYSGWWQGCRFHITKSNTTDYQTADGRVITVVDQPEPPPPREPGCVDREPTEGEINAMQAEVVALNARDRPAGLPELPPLAPSRSGKP